MNRYHPIIERFEQVGARRSAFIESTLCMMQYRYVISIEMIINLLGDYAFHYLTGNTR